MGQGLGHRYVFRVMIVQFMDAQSLDIRALKKSCIHMARPDGRMIPFESYNLFYRDGLEQELAAIRRELDQQHAQRRAATGGAVREEPVRFRRPARDPA